MYWEEYDIELEVGDIILHKSFRSNELFTIETIGTFPIRISYEVYAGSKYRSNLDIAELKFFRPSKQLLRKHKLKKILNN